jgi:hypothetical protein
MNGIIFDEIRIDGLIKPIIKKGKIYELSMICDPNTWNDDEVFIGNNEKSDDEDAKEIDDMRRYREHKQNQNERKI